MSKRGGGKSRGKRAVDEVIRWAFVQYRAHLEVVYPFAVFGLFSLLLEIRIEWLTEVFDIDRNLQISIDADLQGLISERVSDVLVPVLEEVFLLLVISILGLLVLTVLLLLVALGIAFLVAADELTEASRTQFARTRVALSRLPALFAATVLASLLVSAGLLLLVLPGIYLAVKFALAGPAIVIDDYGPIAGLRAGWQSATGQFLDVFGLVLLGGVIGGLVGLLPVVGEAIGILILLPIFALGLGSLYVESPTRS